MPSYDWIVMSANDTPLSVSGFMHVSDAGVLSFKSDVFETPHTVLGPGHWVYAIRPDETSLAEIPVDADV